MIYLESSATSFLKPPQVAEAVFKSFSTIGNAGRGAHAPTLNASRLIYDTRDKLAALFGSPDPSRIVFACNATEALNIAFTVPSIPVNMSSQPPANTILSCVLFI